MVLLRLRVYPEPVRSRKLCHKWSIFPCYSVTAWVPFGQCIHFLLDPYSPSFYSLYISKRVARKKMCIRDSSEPRLTAPGTPCDQAATVRQTGGRALDESATGVLQAGSTHFPPEKHMLDYPEYTLGIQARYGEAGTDGKIRLGALANWFQEAAGHNASALGFGDERLFAEGKAWILTRMAFRIKDLPLSLIHICRHRHQEWTRASGARWRPIPCLRRGR